MLDSLPELKELKDWFEQWHIALYPYHFSGYLYWLLSNFRFATGPLPHLFLHQRHQLYRDLFLRTEDQKHFIALLRRIELNELIKCFGRYSTWKPSTQKNFNKITRKCEAMV